MSSVAQIMAFLPHLSLEITFSRKYYWKVQNRDLSPHSTT
jgi:hypothetical protein